MTKSNACSWTPKSEREGQASKIRILTVLGTRPEIIRLSRIIPALDEKCEHYVLHTGQNYAELLSSVFFSELGLRAPNRNLNIRSHRFSEQAADILRLVDEVLEEFRPERLLVLGDTNSGLAALPAARRGIDVFHLEAGNRSYDPRIPEELNRRVIDHASSVHMPYTERSKDNLIREGFRRDRIFVVGNPIAEVINHHRSSITNSDVLRRYGLEPHRYLAVTIHRSENVDDPARLAAIFTGIQETAAMLNVPAVVSTHPRTRDRMTSSGMTLDSARVRLCDPLGFFDFVRLESAAQLVLTDSGTVQEECAILHVPAVVLRDVTERPETVECGATIIGGTTPESILGAARVVGVNGAWQAPEEYLRDNVGATVVNIVLGYVHNGRLS